MFTSVLLSTFAVALISTLVGAEPEPVDRRFDVSSAIESATSVALSWVDVLTSDAISWYNEGTEGASWYTVGASYAYNCVYQGVSGVSTLIHTNGGQIMSEAKSVYNSVTCGDGAAETIVASAGGAAYTLVTSGVGVVTSIGGSEFTVVASPTSTPNGAGSVQSLSPILPTMMALVTVVGGTLLGAWITV